MNLANLRSPLAKLLILIALGLPVLCGWPLTYFAPDATSVVHVLVWGVYGIGTSLFIICNTGIRDWFESFSFACVLAVVTCMTGAGIHFILDYLHGDEVIQPTHSVRYLVLGITMLTVVPYALFAVRCFSASRLVQSALDRGKAWRTFAKHASVSLRVLQHTTEVLPMLFVTWQEEHPSKTFPRWHADINGHFLARFSKWAFWAQEAVTKWCLALLIFTLEPIPAFCAEVERLTTSTEL